MIPEQRLTHLLCWPWGVTAVTLGCEGLPGLWRLTVWGLEEAGPGGGKK